MDHATRDGTRWDTAGPDAWPVDVVGADAGCADVVGADAATADGHGPDGMATDARSEDRLAGDAARGEDSAAREDAGPLQDCPEDMAAVGAVCVDRHEASRQDATAASAGVDDSLATCRAGVLPWYVDSMSAAVLHTFESACAAAGKRLCHPDEWFDACTGPEQTTYVFGDVFDPEICNCVDTNCDDFCLDEGIALDDCNLANNCGYSCGAASPTTSHTCFGVKPTGSFAGCTSALGVHDINGNVWEVVPSTTDARGYEIRGGAFNCAWPAQRLACTYNAGWSQLYAGFRCCKDRR